MEPVKEDEELTERLEYDTSLRNYLQFVLNKDVFGDLLLLQVVVVLKKWKRFLFCALSTRQEILK